MVVQVNGSFKLIPFLLLLIIFWVGAESRCSDGCDALGSYYLWEGATLTFISTMFSTSINSILDYNPQITNPDIILSGSRVNVPFSCGCVNDEFMAHQFSYQVRPGNVYQRIATLMYSNLTTVDMLQRFNSYNPNNIPESARLNVTVNCSCGESSVSKDYGLFITYPLRPGESLYSIANDFELPESLLQDYNPLMNFSSGSGLIFVPGKGMLYSGGKIFSSLSQQKSNTYESERLRLQKYQDLTFSWNNSRFWDSSFSAVSNNSIPFMFS